MYHISLISFNIYFSLINFNQLMFFALVSSRYLFLSLPFIYQYFWCFFLRFSPSLIFSAQSYTLFRLFLSYVAHSLSSPTYSLNNQRRGDFLR